MWYGPGNFFWTSDIALFFVFLAILFESKLLASMAIVGNLLYESFWNIDFILLLLHLPSSGVTDYMLNSASPLWLRALSLFHVALPPLMIWLIYKLGYNRKAWRLQMLFSTALIFLTWLVTDPVRNVNFVFGYKQYAWLEMNTFLYLVLLAAANGVVIFVTHCILSTSKILKSSPKL